MVQLINIPARPPAVDVLPGRRVHAGDLGPPPDVLPPEPRSRRLVIVGLICVGLILAFTAVTSAMVSHGAFVVLMAGASIFVITVIWRRPGAHRTRLRRAEPKEFGAVGGRGRNVYR